MTAPAPSTRVFALLGDPVAHSLSPAFQNAALRALGCDGVYVALRCAGDDVAGLVRGLARAGGGGNVTVPHKAAAAAAVDRPSDAVRATGACNTFWAEDGVVHGDNTDVEGVRAAILALTDGRVPASVVMAGAGGAARATAFAVREMGCARLVVVNRGAARAMALRDDLSDGRMAIHVVPADGAIADDTFDLAINATTLGLRDGDAAPPLGDATFGAALDLVVRPGETAWVRAMRAAGVAAADGREMLLMQGAAAFRRWWGVDPPLDVMRAALATATEGEG